MHSDGQLAARWGDVQGNVTPGFKKDHQAFVLISFPDARSGRLWLGLVAPEIASSSEVSGFNAVYKVITARLPGEETRVVAARWCNVALSWRGLALLGAPSSADEFPPVFRMNQVPFTRSTPEEFGAHALLLLAADRPEDLEDDLNRHRSLMSRCRAREVRAFHGNALTGDMRGHEHFGFKDLVSDPVVAGTPEAAAADPSQIVPAHQFILGTGTAVSSRPTTNNQLTHFGSFLAFVQLEQHVERFRSALTAVGRRVHMQPDNVGAAMVGRWMDGRPYSNPPPVVSHVGRARPAFLSPTEVSRHRILRRGVPYGPALPANSSGDGIPRGLLFLAYQSDLTRQFEQIWLRWLNGLIPTVPGSGRDALVGLINTAGLVRQVEGTNHLQRMTSIATAPYAASGAGFVSLTLPQFVTPHFGGYFFAPAKSVVARLAAGAPISSAVQPGLELSHG